MNACVRRLGLAVPLLLLLPSGWAGAATLTVDSLADHADTAPGDGVCADALGLCTLRAALMEANALAGADTVNFSITGTIVLTGSLPALLSGLSLNGPGAATLAIDADSKGSALEIAPGATVSISGVTLTGGVGNLSNLGGGIDNQGVLTLMRVRIAGNHAGSGGGIFNAPGARLTMADSTIDGNSAVGFGGAIYNVGGGTSITITGSTISRNVSGSGAINTPIGTSMAISNSTISGNTATSSGGVAGILGAPNITVTHCTIFANNGIGAAGCTLRNSIVDSCGSGGFALSSQGHNLAPSSACFGIPASSDIFEPNLGNFHLGSLQNNGGATETHALLAGSPAIDAVSAGACPLSSDQRGVSRPQGPMCDIGAFELPPTLPSPTPTPEPAWCFGDCDGDGIVTINELIVMVNIALGVLPPSACSRGDANGDGQITIDEIIAAVNNLLVGCPCGLVGPRRCGGLCPNLNDECRPRADDSGCVCVTLPLTPTSTPSIPPTRPDSASPTPSPTPSSTAIATSPAPATATATATRTASMPRTMTPTPTRTSTPGCPGAVCTSTPTRTPTGHGATVNVIKNTDPDGPQDFAFTVTGGLQPASFLLDDDNDPALSNTQTFTNVPAGTYTIVEQLPPGWMIASIGCAGAIGISTGVSSATITVQAGATVTCTFKNVLRPTPTARPSLTPTSTFGRLPTTTSTRTPTRTLAIPPVD